MSVQAVSVHEMAVVQFKLLESKSDAQKVTSQHLLCTAISNHTDNKRTRK